MGSIEVRPFSDDGPHIDEIVARDANVTIQRIDDYEFLFTVDDKQFQMKTSERKGKAITLVCTEEMEDPDEYIKPEEPKTIIDVNNFNGAVQIEKLRVLKCFFHIEQMDDRDYWIIAGGSTYWMCAEGDGPKFLFLSLEEN